MPKGLYFTAVVFSFFCFWRLISKVTERISTKLKHIFTYDHYLNGLNSPSIYPPHAGGKKTLFRTNFELRPNISLQWNTIINNRKETCQSTGTSLHAPKFGELWSRNGWEGSASFCPPPKFSHWEILQDLPHGRYIIDSRQTLAHVM